MKKCEFYIDEINLLFDGALTSSEEAELREHLAVCPACAERERQLREMKETLAVLDIAEIPEELHGRIMSALPQQPHRTILSHRWVKALAAVAACALLGLVIVRTPLLKSERSMSVENGSNESTADTSTGAAGGGGAPDSAAPSNDGQLKSAQAASEPESSGDMMLTSPMAPSASAATGTETNTAMLPSYAVIRAYTGDLAVLDPELKDLGYISLTKEDADIQLVFETSSETENAFTKRLSELGYTEAKPLTDAVYAYTEDESAPNTLYVLTQK